MKIVSFALGLIAVTVATQFYGPRCAPGSVITITKAIKVADCVDMRHLHE